MKLRIERIEDNRTQTIGRLFAYDTKGNIIYGNRKECHTLELPWNWNRQNVSCIPQGLYKVEKRFSPKFKSHFHVTNVDGRSWILIHKGNFYTDIRGCILVGTALRDINGDGYMDVVNSGDALADLLGLMPNRFELEIVNC